MSGSSYHPSKSEFLALSLDLFVTGAMDGTVNLWEMNNPETGNMFIIEKIFEYPLATEQI